MSTSSACLLSCLVGAGMLLPQVVLAEQPLRPPRLPSSPRTFGRVLRSLQPRTSAALKAGHVWGSRVDGVDERQWCFAAEVEAAWYAVGMFFEAPLVADTARTEGVYGSAEASARGAGDLRFGGDWAIASWEILDHFLILGAGTQITAPTGHARRVQPPTPHVRAPSHSFGPATWTTSVGAGLAVVGSGHYSLQLNGDLVAHLRDAPGSPVTATHWIFGGLALGGALRVLPWLVALLHWDLQLELHGQNELRQLVFAIPALRIEPVDRIALDLGLRLPVRQETRNEHRLSFGLVLSLGLGPERDHAW